MWYLSIHFRQIDSTESITGSIINFGRNFPQGCLKACLEAESSAFVPRLGRQGRQTFAIGLALQTALCRSAKVLKDFATVRHVGGAKQYIPKNRPHCHPESPRCGLRFMGYWCSGKECILEGKGRRIDPWQLQRGFTNPPLRQRGNFNFLAGFYFKSATTRIARPVRVFYWHLECIDQVHDQFSVQTNWITVCR